MDGYLINLRYMYEVALLNSKMEHHMTAVSKISGKMKVALYKDIYYSISSMWTFQIGKNHEQFKTGWL